MKQIVSESGTPTRLTPLETEVSLSAQDLGLGVLDLLPVKGTITGTARTAAPIVTPEPRTLTLFGTGFIGLAFAARRRRVGR